MFCSIASNKNKEQIQLQIGDDTAFERYGQFNVIQLFNMIEEMIRITADIFIFDIECCNDLQVVQAIRRYRIAKPMTRIIIIGLDKKPGDEIVSGLVKLGIYDIISHSTSGSETESNLFSYLVKTLDRDQTPFSEAVKWHVEEVVIQNEEKNSFLIKDYVSNPSEQERVLGTATLAVAGLQHGCGTTQTTLSMARFLSQNGFKVAVVEMKLKNQFCLIYLPRDKSYEKWHFKYKNFDIFANDGEKEANDLIIAAARNKYDYILLDTGLLFEYDEGSGSLDKVNTEIKKYEKGIFYNEFMKASFKVVVSFSSLQFSDSIKYYTNYINSWNLQEVQTIFNFTDELVFMDYKRVLNNANRMPYGNSMDLNTEKISFYNEFLRRVLIGSRDKEDKSLEKTMKKFMGK